MEPLSNCILLGILGFMGGIVNNITAPSRRGVLGFLASAIEGTFCGGVAGLIANSTAIHVGWQYGISAGFGFFSNRILSAMLRHQERKQVINIHGGQNNIGDNDIHGDQNQE